MLKEKARMIARVVYVADLALTTAAFFAAFFIRDLVLPRIAPDHFPTGLFPLRDYVKIYPAVLILWSVLLFSYHSYHSHRTVPLLRAIQRRTPERLRFFPAYVEAVRRIEGKEPHDRVGRLLERVALKAIEPARTGPRRST